MSSGASRLSSFIHGAEAAYDWKGASVGAVDWTSGSAGWKRSGTYFQVA
ncbi:MAG: hypothetical protein WA194_00160 [Patescibacteria group bacterium]